MLNIIDKKQIIHIVAEIIIIFGISIYFSQKNKQLSNLINDLNQRIEDQEEQINNLEKAINNLSNKFTEIMNVKNINNSPVNIGENLIQKNIPIHNIEKQFVNPQNLKSNSNIQVNNLSDGKKQRKKQNNMNNIPTNNMNNIPTNNVNNIPINNMNNIPTNNVNNIPTNNMNEDINNLLNSIPIPIQSSMSMPTIVIGSSRINKPQREDLSSRVEEIFEEEENENQEVEEENEEIDENILDAELEEELKDLE